MPRVLAIELEGVLWCWWLPERGELHRSTLDHAMSARRYALATVSCLGKRPDL
jgi:hypothetical protein